MFLMLYSWLICWCQSANLAYLLTSNITSKNTTNAQRCAACCRQYWYLHSSHSVTLTSLNMNLNSCGVSSKRGTSGVKHFSKSCHFPEANPPKQAPQVIMRRKNVMGNNCEATVWVGNMGQLLTRSASAGVSHSITTASVNTSHRGRGAASIKHHTTGNSSFQPLGENFGDGVGTQQNINKWALS